MKAQNQRILLSELRQQRGWSQVDLANELNVTPGAVANWEAGWRVPGLKMALRVARLFEVPVEKIQWSHIVRDEAATSDGALESLETATLHS